jgi:hypothetical protein
VRRDGAAMYRDGATMYREGAAKCAAMEPRCTAMEPRCTTMEPRYTPPGLASYVLVTVYIVANITYGKLGTLQKLKYEMSSLSARFSELRNVMKITQKQNE